MTPEEVKAAIDADVSLNDDFRTYAQSRGIEITTLTFKEGWKAWEWCLRQLKARGLSDEDAQAYRYAYMAKQARLGTYAAIAECLDNQTPTIIAG